MRIVSKRIAYRTILLGAFLSPLLFVSCKKEAINTPENSVTSDNISDADAPGIYKTASGGTKLVLRPGPKEGQDAWVQWYEYDPSYADGNTATSWEIKVESWTINGGVINLRELIKFAALSQIPDTTNIVSAKLFLYGFDSDPYFPQGNSSYPGSPYNSYGDNACYVERVVSDWDESTVTWNNQPLITEKNRATLAPSTSQWNYNTSVDVTQLVKTMVKNSRNYGFRINLQNETIYRAIAFYSSDATDATKRPKLVITYQ